MFYLQIYEDFFFNVLQEPRVRGPHHSARSQRSTQIKLLSGQLGVCVCYLLAPWGAGVRWRCAGNIQRAGATAGGGGASNPDREKQITAVFLNQI